MYHIHQDSSLPSADSQAKEASQAHLQALQTLSALTAASTQASDPYSHTSSHSSSSPSILTSFLSTVFPTPNQRGPIATAIRIAQRLRQQSWTPRPVLALFGLVGPSSKGGSGRSRRSEEMRGRAVKIVDLLEHSIELGNVDALYTLGRISLVSTSAHIVMLTFIMLRSFLLLYCH